MATTTSEKDPNMRIKIGCISHTKSYDIEQLTKNPETTPKSVSPIALFRYARGLDYLLLFVGFVSSGVTGMGYPGISIIMGGVTQDFMNVMKDGNMTTFSHNVEENCIKFALLGVGIFISAAIQTYCMAVVCENVVYRLRHEFFRAIMRQDITWFDKNQSGTLTSKLFDNLDRFREGSGDKLAMLIQYFVQFLGGFIVALTYDWKITLIMVSLTPVIMVCGGYVGKMMSSATNEESVLYAVAGSIADEVLKSMRTVITFNGQEYESKRYSEALDAGKRLGYIKALKTGIALGITMLAMYGSYAAAFAVGVNMVSEGKAEGGTVITVFFAVMMGSLALSQAAPQLAVLGTAMGAAGTLYNIIDRTPEIDAYSSEGKKPTDLTGRITLRNIRFRYPTRPDIEILKGISLVAEPGQTIALVGSSGCGKSTILQLLLRYYNQEKGQILIDCHEIQHINIEFLRNYIGVVSQEPNLFNTTIEENIRYGRSNVTDKDIIRALKEANAYDFVSKFPEGIFTMVGDRGAQLSGGQKQRIAIARALVRDPKILLLDEATSALDAESEHVVQLALDKASKGRTTLVIAHRLSTIRNADKIIAMKAGEIVEVGTHSELIERKGIYHELVNAQVFADVDEEETGTFVRSGSLLSTHSIKRVISYTDSMKVSTTTGVVSRKNSYEEPEDSAQRLRRELAEEGASTAHLPTIVGRSRPEWFYLAVAFLSAGLQGCVYPAFAVIFVQLIRTFSLPPDQMRHDGHMWAYYFLGFGGVLFFTMLIQCLFFGIASERMTMRYRVRIFRNILRMDGAYFDQPKHSAGKLATRLAADAPNLKAAVDFRLGTALGAIVGVIVGCGVSFFYDWQVATIGLLMLPLVVLGQGIQFAFTQGAASGDANDMEASGKIAVEAIENIRTVQALTLQTRLSDEFSANLNFTQKKLAIKATSQSVAYAFAMSIFFFNIAAMFRFGLYLIMNNKVEIDDVLRVLFVMAYTASTLGVFSGYFPEYQKATMAAGLIYKMTEEEPEIDGMTEEGEKPEIQGSVKLRSVHFRYPERRDIPILKGLDVEVNSGETLALVGASGCGKSTIIGLLERLYNIEDGVMEVDSHDIASMNPRHLRSSIALVSQEPVLFDRSIEENIKYGMEREVSHSEIEDVCRKANIHAFISQLPQRYLTRVGERGTQLSGGQKQRIAIARALLRDPKILLLDEATSALDTESEKIVQDALSRASEGRTCIVVAHRLSTIVNADCIVVMKDGRVVEKGTHEELMRKRGIYYDLTLKQTMAKS